MKNSFWFILTALLVFSLWSCSDNDEKSEDILVIDPVVEPEEPELPAVSDEKDAAAVSAPAEAPAPAEAEEKKLSRREKRRLEKERKLAEKQQKKEAEPLPEPLEPDLPPDENLPEPEISP